MAKDKPDWEINTEAEQIITKLCQLYPERFGGIDATQIGCAMVTNKERPDSQATVDVTIKGVKEPVSLYCSKQYVISFYKNVWDEYDKKQRAVMMFKALLHLPSEEPDGSLIKPDTTDWHCMLKAFGLDYMNNTNLPDLTEVRQII